STFSRYWTRNAPSSRPKTASRRAGLRQRPASLPSIRRWVGVGSKPPYRATLAPKIDSDGTCMNATLARLEPAAFGSPQCAEELTQINESLHRRESLLGASAKASRLLLEAPDVRA